ncbi:MAG: hypothetical protein H7Y00_05915 [Fimbriimonadaceae bacterium]|nr:hypothetical protein [Chitinophagales bacterium]
MYKALLGYFFLFYFPAVHAQVNLVPNPSFEDYTDCPYTYSLIDDDEYIFPSVTDWIKPTEGTSDYYNACASAGCEVETPAAAPGFQYPNSGDAFAGMYTAYSTYDYREYIQAKLTSPLVAGQTYYAGFYVNAAVVDGFWGCGGTTDDIAMYISETRLTDLDASTHLAVTPQIKNTEGLLLTDTSLWYLVAGYFEATGAEEWVTIGNFYGTAATDYEEISGSANDCVYLYVDDVFVMESTVLPLTFIQFSGYLNEGELFPSISLSWTFASPLNNCCFFLEKSTDGKNFYSISEFPAPDITPEPQQYSFKDIDVFPGNNYYRVKAEDNDNSFIYSPVVVIDNYLQQRVTAFTSDKIIYINNYTATELNAVLYTTTLMPVNKTTIKDGNNRWTCTGMPEGIYLLYITDKQNNIILIKKVYMF